MRRRSFLKILGIASTAVILPTGINYLIEHVTKNNYKPDLIYQLFGNLINRLSPEELEYLDSLNWEYTVYRVDGGIFRVSNNLQRRLSYKDWGKGKDVKIVYKTKNIFEATLQQYLLNQDIGVKTARNFDAPYFYNVVRSFRAKDDKAIAKMSKALTGRKISPETTKKILQTKEANGTLHAPKPEYIKQAAREYQLQRTKEERKKSWLKVNQEERYKKTVTEQYRENCKAAVKCKKQKIKAFKNGVLVDTYDSLMDASRALGVNSGSIHGVLNPKSPSRTANGYTFEKVGTPIGVRRVGQYDLNGNLIKEWKHGADAVKVHGQTIRRNLRGITSSAKGYVWKYIEQETLTSL